MDLFTKKEPSAHSESHHGHDHTHDETSWHRLVHRSRHRWQLGEWQTRRVYLWQPLGSCIVTLLAYPGQANGIGASEYICAQRLLRA